MGKTLVLAEKPSVGKEIARVLGCHGGGSGYMAGAQYVVTWALGHLVELAEPEHYGSQYKTWSLDSLPMMPEKMALKVIPETAKQFGVVKTWLHSKEIDSLVIATDAGREGELVARWILDKAGFHKPIKRLWISSQTDKAIREGFANLKDGRAYLPLYRSAVCRAEADWLVGLNVPRAMPCHYGAQLSAGRVQSVAVRIIMDREEEIRAFTSNIVQAFTFGPGLVIDGVKTTEFPLKANTPNKETQRIAIAQMGPLSYLVVTTEGPENPGSTGLTLPEFAQVLYDLGAQNAYNLDGGGSSTLYFNGRVLNNPTTNGRTISERAVSDIVYIGRA